MGYMTALLVTTCCTSVVERRNATVIVSSVGSGVPTPTIRSSTLPRLRNHHTLYRNKLTNYCIKGKKSKKTCIRETSRLRAASGGAVLLYPHCLDILEEG